MNHKPLTLTHITVSMNQKLRFENFSTQIHPGKHIVIIGKNGSGKSTLLKVIQGLIEPTHGTLTIPKDIVFGYVPQTITDHTDLSGGQRFNHSLSYALSVDPDMLLLDEPTNHLDLKNKRSLIGMLQRCTKTVIIVSHDPEVLQLPFDEIWHIEHGTISIFRGNYTEYLIKHGHEMQAATQQREHLQKEKRKLTAIVQEEHKRAAHSRSANKNENDRSLLGAMKESGGKTLGKNLKNLSKSKEAVAQKLADSFVHKKIEPKFTLDARIVSSGKSLVSITDGSCGYQLPILQNIHLQVKGNDRIALIGDNGSGKSTFIKALLRDPQVHVEGTWLMPEKNNIGYLDQHYSTLDAANTVTEVIQKAAPAWDTLKIRKHLNDFLFSTQEAVSNQVSNLSGGEKARLSLACIAAQSPYLLLLDEITNNIDLETREHVIEVLQNYPGAMIIVSHDPQFLEALSISAEYETKDGMLKIVL